MDIDLASIIDAIRRALTPSPGLAPFSHGGAGHERGGYVALEQGYKLHETPGERFDRPAHVFADLTDLSDWLLREAVTERWDPTQAQVLVGPNAVLASANPYDQRSSVVSCDLSRHPYWRGWLALAARQWVTAGDIHAAVRELAPSVADVAVGGSGTTPGGPLLLAELERLSYAAGDEVEEVRDRTGLVGVARNERKVATRDRITPSWMLRLPVYSAAPGLMVDLEALVSARVVDGVLSLAVSLPLREIAEQKARWQVAETLREALGDWTVGLGTHAVATKRME